MQKRSKSPARKPANTLAALMASDEGARAINLLLSTGKRVVIKEGPGCMGKKGLLELHGDGLKHVTVDFGSEEGGEYADGVSSEEMLQLARTFYDLTEPDVLSRIRAGIANIAATDTA